MSALERAVGTVMMVGVPGSRPDDEFLRELERWGAGGVIFFSRHLGCLETFAADLDRIREACARAGGNEPLFAIDHEGGPVLRFGREVSELPAAMALAAAGTPDDVSRATAVAGAELRALGLTCNLAPVLDVNAPENPGIGIRSYGDRPEHVGRYGRAAIEGFQRGGVLATAKHFPGKGAAATDAHIALPVVDASLETLRCRELVPFREAITAGVGLMMSSHVVYPAVDPDNAATFSSALIDGLLRTEVQFTGPVVTDDLEMGGARAQAEPEHAALRALSAGHDLALICHTFAAQCRARQHIRDAVLDGSWSRAALDERVARVEAAQRRVATMACGEVLPAERSRIDRLAGEAIVRLPGGEAVLPLIRQRHRRATLYVPDLGVLGPGVDDRTAALTSVVEALRHALPHVLVRRYSLAGRAMAGWDGLLGDGDHCAIVLTVNAHLRPRQGALLRHIAAKARQTVHVALRNPYDLGLLPESRHIVRLASLGYRHNALAALVDVLCGRRQAQGTLPVALEAFTPKARR